MWALLTGMSRQIVGFVDRSESNFLLRFRKRPNGTIFSLSVFAETFQSLHGKDHKDFIQDHNTNRKTTSFSHYDIYTTCTTISLIFEVSQLATEVDSQTTRSLNGSIKSRHGINTGPSCKRKREQRKNYSADIQPVHKYYKQSSDGR